MLHDLDTLADTVPYLANRKHIKVHNMDSATIRQSSGCSAKSCTRYSRSSARTERSSSHSKQHFCITSCAITWLIFKWIQDSFGSRRFTRRQSPVVRLFSDNPERCCKALLRTGQEKWVDASHRRARVHQCA